MALTFDQAEMAYSHAIMARVKGSKKLSVLTPEDIKDSKCYNSVLSLERFSTLGLSGFNQTTFDFFN